MILSGIFHKETYGAYLKARQSVLCPGGAWRTIHPETVQRIDLEVLKGILDRQGYAHFQMGESLDDNNIMDIAGRLGPLLAELPEELVSYVRHGIILEVKEHFIKAPGIDMQPFSREAVLVHTENSRSPIEDQPKYIIFQCLAAGKFDSPTLLFPMEQIAGNISQEDKEILKHLKYRNFPEAPPFYRKENGNSVFSFRDFGDVPLEWIYKGNEFSAERINEAVENLMHTIYQTMPYEIKWTSSSIFVFDNTRFFHAKPENLQNGDSLDRHLDRIRIGMGPLI